MSEEILISLQQRFAEDILIGRKTVELRRRALRVALGSRVWIYVKQPKGQVQGYAIIEEIVEGPPPRIWTRLGQRTGISKAEFDRYYRGASSAFALILGGSREAIRPLTLAMIRNRCSNFHPPQFFKRLHPDSKEFRLLSSIECS